MGTTGTHNTAMGHSTTGAHNTAVGYNTIGTHNTAMGYCSTMQATVYCVAAIWRHIGIPYSRKAYNTTGTHNTAVGKNNAKVP